MKHAGVYHKISRILADCKKESITAPADARAYLERLGFKPVEEFAREERLYETKKKWGFIVEDRAYIYLKNRS